MNYRTETGKGVPSPFPAPLQTKPAAQNTAPQAAAPLQNAQPTTQVQNTQPTNTTPQANGVSSGAVQPAQAVAQVQNTQPVNAQAPPNNTLTKSFADASTYHYLTGGGFVGDISSFSTYKNRKTGYANMDSIQAFYPGLYGIGAPPSVGKTTFSWQLANQQAYMGVPVLYFSLEQTKYELVAKSLSRRFYMAHCADARQHNGQSSIPLYTSVDIRYGNADITQLSNMAAAQALDTQDRLFIFDGGFSYTVLDICSRIESFIGQTGQTPVVIIDYLQIIAPPNGREIVDTKDKIDQIVKRLKQLQLAYNMTIIVISSLNRQNYMMPVELESFKESGSIEYTFDVVWGLQLSLLNDPNFTDIYDKNGKKLGKKTETEKRIMLSQAKQSTPRSLEMTYVKNRFGPAGQSVLFDYFPAYETFVPR